MQRRSLLQAGLSAGVLATLPPARATPRPGERFKLKYAPHFGMFKHHAGPDAIDQLKFMADEGFRALEDNGFFCVDNLPVQLIPRFIELCQGYREGIERAAFGIDLRGGQFIEGWQEVLEETRGAGHRVEVLFLDASDELLLRRFNETHRPHPLQAGGSVQ